MAGAVLQRANFDSLMVIMVMLLMSRKVETARSLP